MLAPLMPSKPLTVEDAAKLSPSGNSPVMLTKEDLRKVVPLWHDLGVAMNKDESAREVRSTCCRVVVCLSYKFLASSGLIRRSQQCHCQWQVLQQ